MQILGLCTFGGKECLYSVVGCMKWWNQYIYICTSERLNKDSKI